MVQVIVIRFNPDGTPSSSRLFGFLQTLFTSKLSAAEKKHILADRYSIIIEEKEMNDMVDFSEVYWRLGRKEGRNEGLAQGRKEGLSQGREEGLSQGRKEGLSQGLSQGREEGLSQGRKEGQIQLFADLAALNNSDFTVKMAVKQILAGHLTISNISGYLTAEEIADVIKLVQISPLQA